jgi:CRP/FNR family transcriptional regulator, cyclic AMP receptor protein
VTSTSDRLLRELPLLAGVELGELADVVGRRELAAGEELWRQGQEADALYVVETGTVVVAARLPGSREVELATLGPREVLGELALLGHGAHTATVRALEPTRVLRLGCAEFRALVSRRDQGARALRRRLTALACARLCARHHALAATLPGSPTAGSGTCGEPAELPDRAYLSGLPFFRHFEADERDELLARAVVEGVARGALLVAEGELSRGLFVTLNGAIEEAIRREGAAIRVALAGPGRAFGYAGLVASGGAATATATARERSVVLVVERGEVEDLLATEGFEAAIERDIVTALRQAERPQARLAATARPG